MAKHQDDSKKRGFLGTFGFSRSKGQSSAKVTKESKIITPSAKKSSKPEAKPASKSAPKAAKPAKVVIDTTKRYKFLSGIDDSNFCQRVSDHLDAGYELAGSPTMVVKGSTVYVGQAIVRKATKKVAKRKKK